MQEALSTPPLSPIADAMVGFQLETRDCAVLPDVPDGTLLLRARGWKLKARRAANREEAHIEFVLAPSADWAAIERAADEIIALAARLRDLAGPGDDDAAAVALRELEPSAAFEVVPQMREHRIRVRHRHLWTRVHLTCGIGLPQMSDGLDEFLPRETARAIHREARRVRGAYETRTGKSLSPSASGFVDLIACQLHMARQAAQPEPAHLHDGFALHPRSDLCSIYTLLLDDRDRPRIEWILSPDAQTGRTPYLEACELAQYALLFGGSYRDPEGGCQPGPSIVQWFASIVDGRGEGTFHKDLMSPPPGYPLHTGDPTRDGYFGDLGVDLVRKLVLFEARLGPPLRPEVPLNALVKRAMLREHLQAMRYNPGLQEVGDRPLHSSPREKADELLEAACLRLSRIVAAAPAAGADAGKWTDEVHKPAGATLKHLGAMREFDWKQAADDSLAAAARDLIGMREWLERIPAEPDPGWIEAELKPASTTLSACEEVLWAAAR